LGFIIPTIGSGKTPPSPPTPTVVTLVGTVYGQDETTLLPNATVTIEPDWAGRTAKLVTDDNGEFSIEFSDLSGPARAELWAEATGYQKSTRQMIQLDPNNKSGNRLRITLQKVPPAPTNPVANPPLHPVWLGLAATLVQSHPFNPHALALHATSWDALYMSQRGNELGLANSAADAFRQDNYAVVVKFLNQANAVSSSGVWKSRYPTLAASYYLLNQKDQGKAALAAMIASIRDNISRSGYLGSKTTLGFVLQDLSEARAKVAPADQADFDNAIGQVTALRQTARG
jgi:hypothetical protein